ncbi:M28 family peptidase [Aliifodinibius sp. S!AR15-10]|uniref:M28 family peptidase n=1 Tax=Aliifodinibius sp. S!AR15-10 TaxID=2950437 RepID=UPI00286285D2|nr:M28 family peptidase [Aliifodinibius sp. S!AR15-10]MDR8391354.1 M28 family peptidase [Aliifodinibius sp. S!AR15-10]
MKNITSFISSALGPILLFLSVTGISCAQTTTIENNTAQLLPYQDEIDTTYLKKHLSVLSHDSLQGRDTGSRGLKIAARYLADQYREMGLQPVGDEDTYFQHFNLSAIKRDSTVFELSRDGGLVDRSVESEQLTANFLRSFGGSDTLSGGIVFAGFGIEDPSRGINHLGNMDLEGKWVMVFQQIPHVVQGDTLIDPGVTGQTRFDTIIKEKRAAGILIIPAQMGEAGYQASANEITRLAYSEPNQYELKYLENGDPGLPMGYNMVKPSMAARILDIKEGPQALLKYRQQLINNINGFSPQQTGYFLTHIPYTSSPTMETKNVVALLEGSDPELKDEVVVLTSHYDHVGIGAPDSTGDTIYNGADDDGSGTVALLNIAKALTQAKTDDHAPKRSILFLHVSAEEKGLFGSRYYSDHPIFPMDKTVANINIDMIGRVDSTHKAEGVTDYAYIIGSEIISSELDSLMKVANAKSGNITLDKGYNDLQDPNQFYRRSDHWNFGRHRVPFAFFFTGVHEDYHRPSDEIHKIQFEKMARIIRTIYATTVVVANEETPPAVDNEEFIEITRAQPR